MYGKKVNFSFINNIHKYILGSLKPDLTFVLKVSKKVSKKRLAQRRSKNRYDNFSQSFYDKVQNSFIKIAKNRKDYYILNSSANNSNLEKEIYKITSKYLKFK